MLRVDSLSFSWVVSAGSCFGLKLREQLTLQETRSPSFWQPWLFPLDSKDSNLESSADAEFENTTFAWVSLEDPPGASDKLESYRKHKYPSVKKRESNIKTQQWIIRSIYITELPALR